MISIDIGQRNDGGASLACAAAILSVVGDGEGGKKFDIYDARENISAAKNYCRSNQRLLSTQ